MGRKILIYIGGALNILWGISHIIPTQGVIQDFGDISQDNRYIVQMEWINEGFTLIFLGLLVILVTGFTKEKNRTSIIVYLLSVIMLIAMAILSLFTGFRIDFLPFKLCPVIFSLSGILIALGMFPSKAGK